MFLTTVSFFLLLGVLIFFHELGHYLMARRNGIEVEECSAYSASPPRLIKLFTYDGTVFSINAIPFGAFVRMKGRGHGRHQPRLLQRGTRAGPRPDAHRRTGNESPAGGLLFCRQRFFRLSGRGRPSPSERYPT